MAEILDMVVRVTFSALFELVGILDFPGRSRYRDYLDTVPAVGTPLSRSGWKASGKPERHVDAVVE